MTLDSMPALRRQLLAELCARTDPAPTAELALTVHAPTNTARRALEDLTAYRLAHRTKQGDGKADLWHVDTWARERFA